MKTELWYDENIPGGSQKWGVKLTFVGTRKNYETLFFKVFKNRANDTYVCT